MTLRNIKEMILYWANMTSDVQDYFNNCANCVKNQPIKSIKVSKVIIANGPLDRITADCWDIPKEMRETIDNKYHYVLTCIDHFSKFKWTELIPNKNAHTIRTKIDYVFNYYGPPKIFQTDNGREFVNEELQDLCKKHNVQFIHGRPYHPQSQGVVEKINEFLAQSLQASYTDFIDSKQKDKSWDIENASKAFTANANRNVHSMTLKVPNKLVLTEDKDEIEEVKK